MIDRNIPVTHRPNVAELLSGALAGHTMQRLRTPDGKYRYSYVSAGVKTSFGLDPDLLMRLDSVEHMWVHPDDRAGFLEALELSAAQLTRLDEEVRVAHQSGGYRWVRSVGTPRRLGDGTVIWDGVALDVTDRHEARAALERTLSQMRETETAEGRFSYIAAQDVTAGLTRLRAAISDLPTGSAEVKVLRDVFADFERALTAARDLVDPKLSQDAKPAEPDAAPAALTKRQAQIMAHISRGETNRDIAQAMGISEGTVKLHVSDILKRLGVQNRTEAALAWRR